MNRILPFFALALAVGIFFGYINPTYTGAIAKTKTEIKSYDSALEAAKKFSAKEDELTRERDAIPADGLARLESFLPDTVDNVQLILDLNTLAAHAGVQLSNFDIKSSTTATNASADDTSSGSLDLGPSATTDSLDLTVTAKGSYGAVRTFLSGVELSLRPLDLVEFQLTDSDTGIYTYQMVFRIYWLH